MLLGGQPPDSPRTVSRGLKLRGGFLGVDSLYIVLEYPHVDVFEFWSQVVTDTHDPRLFEGIPFENFLLRRGGLGYKLSVWDGDARLYMTDRVEEHLRETSQKGHGMGVMLQLGPKWLWKYGDLISPDSLRANIYKQFSAFGVQNAADYRARLNRVDMTLDAVGLRMADLSIDEWQRNWVGFANKKDFHISAVTRQLEGLSIGSSEGVVRFKLYDKVQESIKRGTTRFWRSVWNVPDGEIVDVARFEWTVKVYEANFTEIKYLSDYTFPRLKELLNYASLKWGRLCIPDPEDSNQSRWQLTPLWEAVRELIDGWSLSDEGYAVRRYDLRPDMSLAYLKFIAGSLGGFMARVGIEQGDEIEATLEEALNLLKDKGLSVDERAKKKWELYIRLLGARKQ